MKRTTWAIILLMLLMTAMPIFAYENVALGKSVTYTSSYERDGWLASQLTDGNTDTGYTSDPYERNQNAYIGYTVTVDLEEEHLIDRVVVHPATDGSYFPADFEIWRSFDGVNFEKIAVDYGYNGRAV